MARCEVCDNEYDKTFEIESQGSRHTFDCFECAIEALAPRCATCNVRIIGHGTEAAGTMYCCANCAAQRGASEARDRI